MSKQLLSMVIGLLLTCVVYAQLPDSLADKVDALFTEFANTSSPGCSLAILKNGKIIYEKGYGMSNLEYNIPLGPSSIFHVASVAKQFTAAAIIRLSLEGKLSLTDDIRKYIPEVPDFGSTITINHLLHHTSGLRDGLQRFAGWREEDLVTQNDVLAFVKRQNKLNFLPGDEFLYCNTGYMLLSIVIERITGVSFRKYADSVFFKPLGMNNTYIHDDHAEITPNRTSAYAKDKSGKWKISVPVYDLYGSTSVFTTVEDLAKWDENFYTGKPGDNDFVNAMQLTGTLNDSTPQNYASGLYIEKYKGYKTVWHNGVEAGYRANLVRFPDQHFTVIILANLANIDVVSLCYQVADLFLKYIHPKKVSESIRTDEKMVRGWAGNYFDSNTNATATLVYNRDKLLIGTIPLETVNNFFFASSDSRSAYSFSGDSSNAKFVLHTKGNKKEVYRKINIIILDTAQLRPYTGEFYSPEIDTKYTLSLKGGSLFVKWPRLDEIKLTAFTRDIFTGYLLAVNTRIVPITIVFSRDTKNNITGFYLTAVRIRNLYFEKNSHSHTSAF